MNGKPGAIIAAYQLPGSNAVQAADGLKKLMKEAKGRFPHDIDYVTSLDTTLAVTEGIKEIIETLVIQPRDFCYYARALRTVAGLIASPSAAKP